MSSPPFAHTLIRDLISGLRGRCPACGEGKMFRAFLKVADNCDVCGEELHHQRADDFPAYIVVSIVGHIMLSMAFWLEVSFKPEYWVQLVTVLPTGALLTMLLLQPVKGVIVALQWHMGMDGFAPAKAARALTA